MISCQLSLGMGRALELTTRKTGTNFFIKNLLGINLKNRLKYISGHFELIILFCFLAINRFGRRVPHSAIMVTGGLFCLFVLAVPEGN